MLSSSLPGLTSTYTSPRFTDETPVTGCKGRLACGPPLPRTRCRQWQSSWVRLKSRRLVSPITDAFTQQVWREMLRFPLSASRFARSKSLTRTFKEKSGYMKESIGSTPKQCVDRQRPSQRSNSENHLLIHEGWSERQQGVCLVTRNTARFSVGKCPVWYRGKADDFLLHSDDVGHAISDSPIKGSLNSGTRRTLDV